MPILHRDFETRSVADLKKVGARRYASDPTTCVLCVCFSIDDDPIESFVPEDGKPIPDVFYEAANNTNWSVTAHNDPFETAIEESVLGPRFGWPQVPIERHTCTMALARYHGFPGELGKVAVLLGLPFQKDAEGRRLMLQLCKPRKPKRGEDKTKIYWVEVTPEKLARLIAYCKRDVEVERALHHRLPPLPEAEARLWTLDHKINGYGFHADLDFATAAVKLVEVEKTHINARIMELTDGAVTGFTKVNDLRAFVNARGHSMKNFDADAVAEVLKGNPDAIVRKLLELRQASNNPSVAKYVAVLAGAFPDQRIRGSLNYYGTHTGRWTGSGLNVHNLPREDSADALAAIDAVRRGDLEQVREFGPPIEVIGRLARGVVVAPPGRLLLAGDFSMIEPRVASWLAEETWKLTTFCEFDRTGDPMLDAHRVVGAQMQGKPVDPTDNTQRQRGKTVHMALNYGGGPRVWRAQVPDDPRSDGEIKAQEIDKFRQLHPAQTKLMLALERQAIQCVHNRDPICGKRHSFEMDGDTLVLWLPSMRPLFYPRARLEEGQYGPSLSYHNPAKNLAERMWHGAWLAHLVSATSRDLLVNALFKLDAAGFDVILHVHDEVVAEVAASDVDTLKEQFKACMVDVPSWAKGLPFNTKVRVDPRYIKADSPAPVEPTQVATVIPIRPGIIVPPRPDIIKPSRPAVVIPIDYTSVPLQPTPPPAPAPVAPADDEPETEIDLADLIGDVPKSRKICCPFHDETTPSLHVYPDHYYCFGCHAHGDHISWLTQVEGLSFFEAVEEIANWDGPVVERSAMRDAKDDAERTAYALRWWIAAKPMTGRPAVDGSMPMTSRLAARYLADTRGIDIAVLPDNISERSLRFHRCCVFGKGVTHPCLVALMRDPITGEPTGIQRTALTQDAHKIDRRMLGPAGVVQLWPASKQLVIGEGLETTLAAATRLDYCGKPLRPAWATLSDGAMARFPVIDGVERLIILADNDVNRAGQIAAEGCKQRWLEAGRRVALLMPDQPGTDFNDIVLNDLKGRAAS